MDNTYDYVIVGAGSSGCTLAARLARQGDARVLLVEAGGSANKPLISMPLGFFALMGDGPANWGYRTAPEPALDGRCIALPRGRVLGGSSAINGMIYIRGQHQDFDEWSRLGNAGWDYASLLPYFRKSENHWRGGDAFHGSGGGLEVQQVAAPLPIADRFIDAARECGIPANADFNAATQAGVGYFDVNIRHGKRQHTARAFLRAARRKANLHVLRHGLVQQILLDRGRASGVRLRHAGGSTDIRANREVILCAGSLGSPPILERSGIGNPAVLARAGIEVVHALPSVGEHLKDHLNTVVQYATHHCKTYYDYARPRRVALTLLDYLVRGRGICANPAAIVGAFVAIEDASGRPDAEIHFAAAASVKRANGRLDPIRGICATICRLRPESTGSVHAASPDPAAAPVIHMNYLAAPADAAFQLRAVRRLREIFAAPALAPYITDEVLPGPETTDDAALLAFIRATSDTVHHPVGTCRMGTGEDAVVDPQLRVRGLDGLRIADASIFPTITSGNTNAACVMVAEKAADIIAAG